MQEYLIRFVVGGAMVSLFAFLGDVFRPKSFAGLFGAAPSVAFATLALTLSQRSADYAANETRTMIIGAAALGLYAVAVCQLTKRFNWNAFAASSTALVVWFSLAFATKW